MTLRNLFIIFGFLIFRTGEASERAKLEIDIPISSAAQPVLKAKLSQSRTELPSFRGNVNKLMNNTVSVVSEQGIGSGVILSPGELRRFLPASEARDSEELAFVVTNFHVIESMTSPTIVYYPGSGRPPSDGIAANAQVVSTEVTKDLAILVAPERPDFAQGVVLGDVSSNIIGDSVEAIGHPEGNYWSYTKGYVSQVRFQHEWIYENEEKFVADVIQTQTPISPGNSGGPLFDQSEKLIGVNTMVSDGQNINFAVSVEEIKKLKIDLDQIEAIAEVKDDWNWKTTPQLLGAYDFVDSGADEEYSWQSFNDPNSGTYLVAMFEDKSSAPYLYYEVVEEGDEYSVFFDPTHDHLSAWFAVEVYQGEDLIASGWDFDGDLVADYLF